MTVMVMKVEQLSLDKTLDVSVDKDLYRVPDDGAEEKSEEDEEAAPPQRPLPGLVAEVPEEDDPQQEPHHGPGYVRCVGDEVVLAGVPVIQRFSKDFQKIFKKFFKRFSKYFHL